MPAMMLLVLHPKPYSGSMQSDSFGKKREKLTLKFQAKILIKVWQNGCRKTLSPAIMPAVWWVYLGYDASNFFEPVLDLKYHEHFAPLLFGLYTDGLIYDKLTGGNSLFLLQQKPYRYCQRVAGLSGK